MQSLMLLSLLSTAFWGASDPPTTAEAIQQRAVAERLKIKSGQFHVRNVLAGYEADATDVQVAFDYNGRRFLRLDRLSPPGNILMGGGAR